MPTSSTLVALVGVVIIFVAQIEIAKKGIHFIMYAFLIFSISITKTAQYVSVYKAVLTIFMLYVYDKNIDNILENANA